MQTASNSVLAKLERASLATAAWEAGVDLPSAWGHRRGQHDSADVWSLMGCSSSAYKRRKLKLSKPGRQRGG